MPPPTTLRAGLQGTVRQVRAHAPHVRTVQPVRSKRVFLFLQGPISPFFPELAVRLQALGHRIVRINLCLGDRLFWRLPGALDYRGSAKDWSAYVTAVMRREGVTDLLLLGEKRDYHRAAIAAAQRLDVSVTVTDFGYLRPDWITFERNGMSADSMFPRDPGLVRRLARNAPAPDFSTQYRDSFFNLARWDMLYNFANMLGRALYPRYKTHLLHHPILIYLGTGWRLLLSRFLSKQADRRIQALKTSQSKYYVFPLQMAMDFQIRAYSKYPNLHTPIRDTIRSFARAAPKDAQLVLKVHPLDPGLVNWERIARRAAREAGVADRVDYIDGGSLLSLLRGSAGVVTINSTVGIWALREQRPLIALGSAIYNIRGLVFEGELDEFWCSGFKPDNSLCEAFIRALADTVQIRGVYYNQPGLDAAVAAAADRLQAGLMEPAMFEGATRAQTA